MNFFKNKKLFFIAPHADDEVIGCGAILFSLSKIYNLNKPKSIHIAYATSGFNGVSEVFLKKNGTDFDSFKAKSLQEQREIKSEIRKKEAIACCNYLGVESIFWELPFYEKQEKIFTAFDIEIIKKSITGLKPDIIFLIDESSDPHGTHGLIKEIILCGLQNISYFGTVLGYRVWNEEYTIDESSVVLPFNDFIMREKEKLMNFYKSQIQDPAFSHEHHSFIELMKRSDKKMAKKHNVDLPFAECFKILKI